MNPSTNSHSENKALETLALLEKEEREFRNHWVWKELQCTPEQFFKAVDQHVKSLNIPQEKWNGMYEQAKQASKVRSLERRTSFNPVNLKMIGALRV